MTWTVESLKHVQQRPDVFMLLLGKAHRARLMATSPRIVTVTLQGGPRAYEQYEFPWETVVEALNTDTALVPLR